MGRTYAIEYLYRILDKYSPAINKMKQSAQNFGQKAVKSAKKAKQEFKLFGIALGSILSANAIMGLSQKIANGFKMIVTEAMKIEDAVAAFQPLMGGVKQAQEVVNMLNETAATTPFQFEQLSGVTRTLLGYGVATKKTLIPTLRMLGDTAGGNAAKFQSIALAYGQMMAAGKISMQDLNQMTNAGVPLLKQLAKQWGVTIGQARDMAKDMPIEEVKKAFEAMTSEGGMFYNGMEIASKTLSGKISTFKDNISLTMAAIGMSTMTYTKKVVDGLIMITQKVRSFVQTSTIMPTIMKKIKSISFEVKYAFKNLSPELKILFSQIKLLLKTIFNFYGFFIKPVITSIKYSRTFLNIIRFIIKFLTGYISTIQAIIQALEPFRPVIAVILKVVAGMVLLAVAIVALPIALFMLLPTAIMLLISLIGNLMQKHEKFKIVLMTIIRVALIIVTVLLAIAGLPVTIGIGIYMLITRWTQFKAKVGEVFGFFQKKVIGIWEWLKNLMNHPFFMIIKFLFLPLIAAPSLILKAWGPVSSFFDGMYNKIKQVGAFLGIGKKMELGTPTGQNVNVKSESNFSVYTEPSMKVVPYKKTSNTGFNYRGAY